MTLMKHKYSLSHSNLHFIIITNNAGVKSKKFLKSGNQAKAPPIVGIRLKKKKKEGDSTWFDPNENLDT